MLGVSFTHPDAKVTHRTQDMKNKPVAVRDCYLDDVGLLGNFPAYDQSSFCQLVCPMMQHGDFQLPNKKKQEDKKGRPWKCL